MRRILMMTVIILMMILRVSDDNYITAICGELAAKEEVNKVDLDQR